MPLLTIPEHRRQAELRRAAEVEVWERLRRRERVVVVLLSLGWNVVGAIIMGLGMASVDPVRAAGLFALGPLVGYTGMGLTLLVYFVRLGERGDI